MAERKRAPRLYLISPPLLIGADHRAAIEAALNGDVAALLLRFGVVAERERVQIVKALAPIAQAKGVAVLVEDDVAAAQRGGADGVHVTTGIAALREAIERLKPDRIVGAGQLGLRHDAMEAGDAGADYVMFGEPHDGKTPPLHAVAERARWWAEVFEAPGVAYAPDAAAEASLGETGIDFIARPLGLT